MQNDESNAKVTRNVKVSKKFEKKSEQFLWNWGKRKVVNMQENPYIYDLIYIKFKF